MSKYPENRWKLMKIANTDTEILHNFWTFLGISMKFSRKILLMIILKVTKNQGFTLSLEDTFFKKPHGVGGGGSIWPPPQAILRLRKHFTAEGNIFHLTM